MKRRLKKIILTFACFSPLLMFCQENFVRNTNVSVLDQSNNILSKPWVGGFNHTQFSEVDLNLDGRNDLFVFDRAGNKISTFINSGIFNSISYQFSPQYKDSFPALHDWVLFRDYNCDGKMDIFTYSSGGAAVYKNISSTKLEFELTTNLIYSDFLPDDTLNNPINLYISSVDIPAIDDIDNDGDLDIITFSILGTYAEYHKNMSKEVYGTCDSLNFKLSNKCWGYFSENLSNNSVTLNDTCSGNILNPQRLQLFNEALIEEQMGYKKHSGSTLFTIDLDSNGSKELVLGDISFNNLTVLINGDTSINQIKSSIVSQDMSFPANTISTTAVDIDIFPTCFYIDVNNDNVKDLIVTNNCFSGCENTKSVWLYLNNGSNNNPQFVFQQDNFLQNEMIEVGERAFPVFFDYDDDGLKDIVISNYGIYDKSTALLYKSSLHLYKNVGTITQPAFKLIDTDFAGLSGLNLDLVGNKPVLGIYPTFGDLTGDGAEDMIIGDYFGNLHYFVNTAGVGNPAVFVLNQPKYASIDVGNYAAPQLVDLNRDGKLDLVIGKENGYFSYYQNSGTITTPSFIKITDSLGMANTKHPMIFKGNSVPSVVDDNGSYVLFAGSASGNIFKFTNIDGNLNGTFTRADTNFLLINEGINSAFTISELNNDNHFEMVLGNQSGGVSFFDGAEAVISVQELENNISMKVYPNPASTVLNIEISQNELKNTTAEIFDCLGKSVMKVGLNRSYTQLPINNIRSGIYILKINNNQTSTTLKWIKQ
ncbi:MAG: T9SS type A sorting domain-containing protein [Flavobacteriales bacterium]|nr:T9SS type A sorting domain-containing protein [Flavobacteriales bacterium]